jgi:L-ascorbate metabolism protein UlaG (beta-lactamase superfamily)
MVPVDGAWTLNHDDMIEVLRQIKPKIIIPMHIFTQATLDKFLTKIGDLYAVRHADGRTVVLTRSALPAEPEIMVLPGG